MKQRFRKTGTGMLLALALSSCGFSWQQEGNGGREYIVESGLREGDLIVAEGAGLVREGASVDGTSGATEQKEGQL